MFTRLRARAAMSVFIPVLLGAGLVVAAPAVQAATPPTAPPTPVGSHDYALAGCNNPQPAPGTVSCDALVRTGTGGRFRENVAGPPAGSVGPADIQAAYQLPQGGAGQTVALVDAFGDSTAESDLATFRQQFGLPACTTANGCFRKVDQTGGTNYPPDDADWGLETSLDLDAVSSACPLCHILLVEGVDNTITNLATAEVTAVALGAKFVSNSYSAGESQALVGEDSFYDHPGVVITGSSGDVGNEENWPASDPNVVSVGGTTLTRDPGTARGWTETAWDSGGSGCSSFEPRPAYQASLTTDCANRADVDISADADPDSGLAVFDSGKGGWEQVGGTSMSAPLIAGMYALAGTPPSGQFPVSFPYLNGGNGLFDVTSGSNGSCGTVLCTAGPGWDGPTGMGTPDGVGALTLGPQGIVTGQATDTASHAAVAGATVTMVDPTTGRRFTATTDATGHYTINLSAGTYTTTVSKFGYQDLTLTGVVVTENQTTTSNLAMTKAPSRTLRGTVTDGGGHKWPLYAKITIDGDPDPFYTSPFTGQYTVNLPQQSLTMHVTPVAAGYQAATVTLGPDDTRSNVAVPVDKVACSAPGYSYPLSTGFEDWSGTTPEHGWTLSGSATNGWMFDNRAEAFRPPAPSTGNFAQIEDEINSVSVDSTLTSPVIDLTGQTAPTISFDTFLVDEDPDGSADVDLSLDGGRTWQNVWQQQSFAFVSDTETVPIPQAAGDKTARIRFHMVTATAQWGIDDVTAGSCTSHRGALVTGFTNDANTHTPLSGVTVADSVDTNAVTTSAATPTPGLYWLFEPTGRHTVTAAQDRYATTRTSVFALPNTLLRKDITLQAGHLVLSRHTIDTRGDGSQLVTFTNTGRVPVHATFDEQDWTYLVTSAPVTQPAASWTSLAGYPVQVVDNATGFYAGKLYSVGGVDGDTPPRTAQGSFVYDPTTNKWSPIANLPEQAELPMAAFIDGTMYVTGGLNVSDGTQLQATYAYHPSTNTWTRLADLPVDRSTAGIAVLDGQLYVIGGCAVAGCDTTTSTTYRYDPTTNQWRRLADYPTPMQSGSCAGVDGMVVCAGGVTLNLGSAQVIADTFAYDPATNTWTRRASLPDAVEGMASSGANGELQVAGGFFKAGGIINPALQYDPATNVWTPLPAPPNPTFFPGGTGCGMYQVGGAVSNGVSFPGGTLGVARLAGYDQCGGDQLAWLNESQPGFDLAPGRSVTVRISETGTRGTGNVAARLLMETDSPYVYQPIDVNVSAN